MIIQKLKQKKNQLYEFSWIFFGKSLSFAGMLFLVGLLTKNLTTVDYAMLALGLTFCNLINQAIMGSISQGIGRYFSIVLESGGFHSFRNAALKIVGSASACILFFGIASWIFFWQEEKLELAHLIFGLVILSIVNGLNDIFNSIQNLARNRMHVAITSGIDAWLKVLLVGILLNLVEVSVSEVVFCYVATAIVVLFIQIDKWRKFDVSLINDDRLILNWGKEIYKFSFPASIWGIFVWIQQASDKWALQFFSSINDVAHYSALYQIGYIPFIMGIGLLVTMYTPILYRKSKLMDDGALYTQDHRIITILGFFICGITLLAFSLLWIFNKEIMMAFTAPAYYISGPFLPWMALGAGVFALADLFYIKMMGEIRVEEILAVKILASLIGVAYNCFGAYWFALSGVVFANILFALTYLLIIYIASSSKHRFRNYFG